MSSTPEFESGKKSELQTTYHRLQTKTGGSSNLPGAIHNYCPAQEAKFHNL